MTSQATKAGNNQESIKMESGKNNINKNRNVNDISTVLVLNRSQFLGQKCSLQMMIKIINFKILPYSSTLCSTYRISQDLCDTKADVIKFILSSIV